MAGNFIKGGMVTVKSDKKFVIDSNETVRKKLEDLQEKMQALEEESAEETFVDEFAEGLNPVQVAMLVSDDGENADSSEEAESDGFSAGLAVKEAIQERPQPVSQEEIDAIKEAAREEGFNAGHEEGLKSGLADAEEQINLKMQELDLEYNNRLQNLDNEFAKKEDALNADYQQKLADIEPDLVDKIMDIIIKVVGIDLTGNKETVISILNNALGQVDNSRHYLIHVSPDDYLNVKNSKADICEGTGLLEEAFDIISDNSVPSNGAMIESEAGIFDCGLGTQLELLKKQLLLISFQ